MNELPHRNGSPSPLPAMPQIEQPQLVIRVNLDGSIQVSGPVHNKMLCYGMLESARVAIQELKSSPIIGI